MILVLYCQTNSALVWNQPYDKKNISKKILNLVLLEPPYHMDPQEAYDSNSQYLLQQIYEYLYHYEYLSDNYQLVPLLAEKMPIIHFLNAQRQTISPKNQADICYTVYTIPIKKHVFYQPHPAFNGNSREVIAEDFVNAFKRTKDHQVNSPIVGLLNHYVVGYQQYHPPQQHIKGVQAKDRYTLEITTNGYYAQFIYWLSMTLLSPIPYEASQYYQKNNDKDQWRRLSIGTGPYMLANHQSYQKIRLIQNPNYRKHYFLPPPGAEKRYTVNQGQLLPLSDTIDLYFEKEVIPRWNKFLQGYYDLSSIPSESFEKVLSMGPDGAYHLGQQFQNNGLRFNYRKQFNINSIAFNFQDPILGGNSLQSRYLRQAISIAFDFKEYNNIFENAYSKPAQGPLPQILLDKEHLNGFNPYIFKKVHKKVVKKGIKDAQQLLVKAGYPNGINPKTKKPLVLNMDVESTGKPYEKAVFAWYRKQLLKLGVQLNIRENDKNRLDYFVQQGLFQMTNFAWLADYPDAENFYMLFYSKNSSKFFHGKNISNYHNKQYDLAFEKLQTYLSPTDKKLIEQRLYQLLIRDCVWIWGSEPQSLFLHYHWTDPVKNAAFIQSTLQYYQLYPHQRLLSINQRNHPRFLPIFIFLTIIILFLLPFFWEWQKWRMSQARRVS